MGKLFAVISALFFSQVYVSATGDEMINKGYQYSREFKAYYKFVDINMKPDRANQYCIEEGAKLFFPKSDQEATYALLLIPENEQKIWIGAGSGPRDKWTDLFDVEGNNDSYLRTLPSLQQKPENFHFHFVTMNTDKEFGYEKWVENLKFICKTNTVAQERQLSDDEIDQLVKNGYVYKKSFNALYKYVEINPYYSYYAEQMFCNCEGGTTFLPESKEESLILNELNITELVYVGISHCFSPEYISVEGKPISKTYVNWAKGEPLWEKNLVAVDKLGQYYSVNDHDVKGYICQKKLADMNSPDDNFTTDIGSWETQAETETPEFTGIGQTYAPMNNSEVEVTTSVPSEMCISPDEQDSQGAHGYMCGRKSPDINSTEDSFTTDIGSLETQAETESSEFTGVGQTIEPMNNSEVEETTSVATEMYISTDEQDSQGAHGPTFGRKLPDTSSLDDSVTTENNRWEMKTESTIFEFIDQTTISMDILNDSKSPSVAPEMCPSSDEQNSQISLLVTHKDELEKSAFFDVITTFDSTFGTTFGKIIFTVLEDEDFNTIEYKYVKDFNSYYKINEEAPLWSGALTCSCDKSVLFYPQSKEEAETVFESIPQKIDSIWMGVMVAPSGEVRSLTGEPVTNMNITVNPDAGAGVILHRNLTYDNVNLENEQFAFVSKKDVKAQSQPKEVSEFEKSDLMIHGYNYYIEFDSWYKYYDVPSTFEFAFVQCAMDGATLYLPETEKEFQEINSRIDNPGSIWLGMTKLMRNYFVTVNGQLASNYYIEWARGQPKLQNDFVVLNNRGKYYTAGKCDKHNFICKKSMH